MERPNVSQLSADQLAELNVAIKQKRAARFLHGVFHHDKAEDRANDVKTHDNPNHASHHANQVVIFEAEQQIRDSS